MKTALFTILLILPLTKAFAHLPGDTHPPRNAMIKVAVVLSEHATVIDFAGPWEVFQDTMLKDDQGNDVMPFDLYTVAPSKAVLHTTGSGRPGLAITPDYSFSDAPLPDIVVVGAQSGGPGLEKWLRKVHARHKLIMSVCTGAFKLGKAGLLDGKAATTHHWYFGNFARDFPTVKLVREVRYVQADPLTFTAGGLTSGVDLALHIVDKYFGQKVAQKTADYMEYQGTGWKSNQGISELTTPVARTDWTGRLADGHAVVLHMVTRGASTSFTADFPWLHASDVPTRVRSKGNNVTFRFDIEGRPAVYVGKVNKTTTRIDGMFKRQGKSYPLALVRKARR